MSEKREHLPSFSGLIPEEIQSLLAEEPSFRGKQIFSWIHRGVAGFEEMTTLPKDLRKSLAEGHLVSSSSLGDVLRGEDGTEKYRIDLSDGLTVEAVLLTDEKGRRTACLSTQAGCAMGCAFCRTGTMGFKRNLTAGEIIDQYNHMRNISGSISNIVFMGMGEPLLNIESLEKSIRILTHPQGPALSPRRITVSTCGIVPGINTLAASPPFIRLAVSIPTADSEKRKMLMPGASRYGLEELKEAMRRYQEVTASRMTIETALFRGFNTGRADAGKMAEFAGGLKVVINLIPFNPFEGSSFSGPSEDEVREFTRSLEDQGLIVTRRFRRGRGILGACGQLAT